MADNEEVKKILSSLPPDAIISWADGACSIAAKKGAAACTIEIPRPGSEKKAISLTRYLTPTTNNIAELTAIEMVLDKILELEAENKEPFARTIVILSDSKYAINVLDGSWRAKMNVELVAKIRAKIAKFSPASKVCLTWVRGHNDIPGNVLVDQMADKCMREGMAKDKSKKS